jgi:hypothetical protein
MHETCSNGTIVVAVNLMGEDELGSQLVMSTERPCMTCKGSGITVVHVVHVVPSWHVKTRQSDLTGAIKFLCTGMPKVEFTLGNMVCCTSPLCACFSM